jgi:hypothetical protein
MGLIVGERESSFSRTKSNGMVARLLMSQKIVINDVSGV